MHHLDPDSLSLQGRALRRLAVALVGPDASDDVVQDALVLATQRGADSQGNPPTQRWLRGVVRNKAREHRRAQARLAKREGRARPSRTPTPPDEHAATMDTQRAVVEALHALPEPYRLTLWLRFFAGKRTAAIAREMDVPAATVRTRIPRGLERLRASMDAQHDGERKMWQAALLPLSSSSVFASMSGAGTFFTSKGLFAACAAALVGAVGWVVLSGGEDQPERELAPVTAELADVGGPVLVGTPPSNPATSRGVVADGPDKRAPQGAVDNAAVVSEGHVIRGRVLTDRDLPVAGATVYAIPHKRPVWGIAEGKPSKTRTDKRGGFALEVPDVKSWLAARVRGVSHYAKYVDLSNHIEGQRVVFRLDPVPEMTVHVTDVQGVPIALASIHVIADFDGDLTTWSRPGEPAVGVTMTHVDADGTWRGRYPHDGPKRITVGHKGYATQVVRHAPGDDPRINIVLPPSAVVRVRTEPKEPVGLFALELVSKQATSIRNPRGAHRDAAGDYVISEGLGPGEYTLEVHAPRYYPVDPVGVVIPESGDDVLVELELALRTDLGSATLRHPVLVQQKRTSGPMITPFDVYFRREGQPWQRHHGADWSAADGALPMRQLPAGAWTFVITHRSGETISSGQATVRADADAVVSFRNRRGATYRMPAIARDIGIHVVQVEVEAGGRRWPLVYTKSRGCCVDSHLFQSAFKGTFLQDVGPYPGNEATLVMTLSDGQVVRQTLERVPARSVSTPAPK